MHFSVVDTIEQNVEQVTINVDEGNRQLEKGVMYKVREGGRERKREGERAYCALHLVTLTSCNDYHSVEMLSTSSVYHCHHHFCGPGGDHYSVCHCWLHSEQEVLAYSTRGKDETS